MATKKTPPKAASQTAPKKLTLDNARDASVKVITAVSPRVGQVGRVAELNGDLLWVSFADGGFAPLNLADLEGI